MAHYRLSHIDLSTRIALGLRMLDPAREWGEVSQLAREYGVSRKFLYEVAAQAQQALQSALAPKQAGRKPQSTQLVVDRAFLDRAMLVLATALPGSMRGIQLTLELLFGRHCALGLTQRDLAGLRRSGAAVQRAAHRPAARAGGSGRDLSRAAALLDRGGWTLLLGAEPLCGAETRCNDLGPDLSGASWSAACSSTIWPAMEHWASRLGCVMRNSLYRYAAICFI